MAAAMINTTINNHFACLNGKGIFTHLIFDLVFVLFFQPGNTGEQSGINRKMSSEKFGGTCHCSGAVSLPILP
jgi:hypothetical protein